MSVFVSPIILQVDSFQEYVKPELNPNLSDFCVKLTGITQVGSAPFIQSMFFNISVTQYDQEFCVHE